MSFIFHRKQKNESATPTTIYNIGGNQTRSREKATKHEKLEAVDTFTGDSIFDRAVARRVIGLNVKVQRVKGPKNVAQMHEQGVIHSTYRAYVEKDEVYHNLSPKQLKMIERADNAIDRYYAHADRIREEDFERGKIPTHRSINLHHRKNIKQERFTPNAQIAKREKLKLEEKLGFKIEGEIETDEKSRIEEPTTVKKKKKFLL